MPITVEWDDAQTRQIVLVSFSGEWTQDDYQRAAQDSATLMRQSPERVSVVFDMSNTVSSATNKDSFDTWLAAVNLWREQANYAGFWVVIKPGYWGRMIIWALSKLYNPTQVEVASMLDEARSLVIERLKKS